MHVINVHNITAIRPLSAQSERELHLHTDDLAYPCLLLFLYIICQKRNLIGAFVLEQKKKQTNFSFNRKINILTLHNHILILTSYVSVITIEMICVSKKHMKKVLIFIKYFIYIAEQGDIKVHKN